STVILGCSEGASKYIGTFQVVIGMVNDIMETMDITGTIAVHLDHGSSFDNCKQAIDAGFTSVMIDNSKLPIDEKIENTRKVVEYAHAKGASVEAEIGSVGGTED